MDTNIHQTEMLYSTSPADFDYVRVNVPCQSACPAYTNIPAYIRSLYEGKYDNSYELNRIVNLMPGVLGRICSRPCEQKCRHGEPELGKPVNICHIKRAADDHKDTFGPPVGGLFGSLNRRICIVGAGPAGLAAAHDLATLGAKVTILEALAEPGGMLMYGIPEFRLPRQVLREEIGNILKLGVELKTGVRVGKDVAVEDLMSGYDAVLLAAGCYTPKMLEIPGENLVGVYPGLDFVMRVADGIPPRVGDRVIVLGAGFTAFDCARTALRLGAKEVSICIRGTEQDLRVTHEEIFETKREGISIQGLLLSQRLVGSEKVEGVEFVRTHPGEVLPNGRRRIEPIAGSEFIQSADTVIVAIGQGADPIPSPGEKDKRGVVKGDPETFRTSLPGLYVAGDFMTGPSTVIESIAAGRKAAEKIAESLTGKKFREWTVRIQDARITDRQRAWDMIPRQEMPTIDPPHRLHPFNIEVELGLPKELAHEESKRCYLCYLHYEIDVSRCIYCRLCIDSAPRDCIKLAEDIVLSESGAISRIVETNSWRNVSAIMIDNERCIRCGECVRVCPVDCISVSKVELTERAVGGI
ncbi:FAD-dependent oxidoreductase [Desulfomonile tiedjei]|uniref:NADPH-dependent glutamate synthase beta chain-like oxidoreductase n=1 Tax=Desulfomonile tiedjei (strain ATCC 49306 / DSM 6799 / DCB-1) TaxID=706587 RepID=I4CA14_DESTA|nr:FAD-dependent oxidoreductase [Desulfomonile tiedjei]AFM26405.1 NADPH-dependent glutamate synthase beta chain-like oxidoreductase [Desulfomonile tiedjei DSM 6799]